jgi:hypothetical protein
MILLAVVFSLASLAVPSWVHGVSSFVEAATDQCVEIEVAAAPAFKPCGKKINGQAVSCTGVHAVLPAATVCQGDSPPPVFAPVRLDMTERDAFKGWFRPPRD